VIADRVLKAEPKVKPLAVYLAPRADNGLLLLQEHGVASFRTPESCADAVNTFLNWRAPDADATGKAAAPDAAAKVIAAAGARMNELDALGLFSALGIEVVESAVVTDPDRCPDLGGAAAIKLLSPDVLHKTEAGMVRLGVEPAQLKIETKALLAKGRSKFPQARIDGILVQRMERGLAEVIIGYRVDAEVGPTILLGLGGVMAELKRSFSVRLAPVSVDTATVMMEEIAELAMLRGYRNLPRGDCMALANAVSALSQLARLPQGGVSEAEINPLLVRPEGKGVVAVDGLVVKLEGKA
jgi:acyl-CoA synthetase (NDP forming)